MQIPERIASYFENNCGSGSMSDLLKAAERISLRYRDGKIDGASVISSLEEAKAYALTRMPATYCVTKTAMEYLKERMQGPEIRSVMDFGAGTGAGAVAAKECFSPEKLCCLERNAFMTKVGMQILSEDCEWKPFDVVLDAVPEALRSDLVMSAYMLNELSESNLEKVLEKLWEASNRYILLLEPGTPKGYEIMMRARSFLIRKGGVVLAPCMNSSDCPLPKGDWCHFTCRVERTKVHRLMKGGDAPFEDEKFSFLAVEKKLGGNFSGNNISSIAEASGEKTEKDCIFDATDEKEYARVLRHPMIQKGYVSFRVCRGNCIEEVKITKKQGEFYKAARKANAGDLIRIR